MDDTLAIVIIHIAVEVSNVHLALQFYKSKFYSFGANKY
jgi:hypothetical protein